MNILCINTCFNVCDVSLSTDKGDFFAKTEVALQHSVVLMRQIDEIINQSGLSLKDLDYVCTAVGPGSFTGIRIGLAVAKGLCDALSINIIPIDTLNLIANNATNASEYIVIKGVADEFFVLSCHGGERGTPTLVNKTELMSIINEKTHIASNENLSVEGFSCKVECLASLNMIEVAKKNVGNAVEPTKVSPLYLRLCQAEIQKRQKNGNE